MCYNPTVTNPPFSESNSGDTPYSDREEGETPAGDPSVNPIFSIAFFTDEENSKLTAVTEQDIHIFRLEDLSSLVHHAIHTYIEPPDDGEWHDLPDA